MEQHLEKRRLEQAEEDRLAAERAAADADYERRKAAYLAKYAKNS